MTIERLVALITPIFAGLAGWIVEWVSIHFPGTPTLDKAQLTAVFVAGATAAFGAALTWLHNRAKHTLVLAKRDPLPHIPLSTNPPPDEGDAGQAEVK
jgi:hypothetical protein